MIKKKSDKENRLLSWARKNKKVLYWPLGGLVYFVFSIILEIFVKKEITNLLLAPLIPIELIISLIIDLRNILDVIVLFLVLEVILFIMGYFYHKIKKKWLGLTIIIIFLFVLFLMGLIFGGRVVTL